MLPKQYRLKKRIAFTATYKTGKTYHCGGITVFCGKRKTFAQPTKIGFVVSKKIHKRAVKRNRIKRLMRECVRLYIKSVDNFDIDYISLIFAASSSALLDKNFYNIKDNINKLMSRLYD